MKELFKPVPNHTDFYISNYGRVINVTTKLFIRPYIHKSRSNYYLRINLNSKKYMLHVLVATVFLERNHYSNTEVDHLDGNTLNPSASNLEWVDSFTNKTRMHSRRWVNVGTTHMKGTNKKLNIRKKKNVSA